MKLCVRSNLRRRIVASVPFVFCLALACHLAERARSQTETQAPRIDLGIIVSPTMEDAKAVLKSLAAGVDFSVLAKERSVDATSVDGGYMGNLDPKQLRAELRDALRGHRVGELTDVVQLPSGFAVLKILPTPPATSDLNPKRISSLLSTGVIHTGALVSGLSEADLAFLDYAKPDDWSQDMQKTCDLRKQSLESAKETMRGYFDPSNQRSGRINANGKIQAHSALAQLYAYSGEMEKSIAEWKAAYAIAESVDPGLLPNLKESLGASYLNLSEMENGVYRDPGEIDIFPPLHPGAAFKQQDNSKQAITYFQKYLARNPNDVEVKWLLNLAYDTLGEYPSGVPAAYLIPEKDFESKENIGRFVDVAPAAGLNIFRGGGGVIVEDIDNDGLLDVIVSSVDMCDQIHYFHNDGNGTFSDRTEQAGLTGLLGGLNLAPADFNNDGCIDFLVLRGGWEFPQRKNLLRNNCNGTFTDVTDQSGIGATLTATQTAVWADID